MKRASKHRSPVRVDQRVLRSITCVIYLPFAIGAWLRLLVAVGGSGFSLSSFCFFVCSDVGGSGLLTKEMFWTGMYFICKKQIS